MFLAAQVLEKEPTKTSNGKKRVNHNKMGVKEKREGGARLENEARKGVESTRAFIAVTTNISFVCVSVSCI